MGSDEYEEEPGCDALVPHQLPVLGWVRRFVPEPAGLREAYQAVDGRGAVDVKEGGGRRVRGEEEGHESHGVELDFPVAGYPLVPRVYVASDLAGGGRVSGPATDAVARGIPHTAFDGMYEVERPTRRSAWGTRTMEGLNLHEKESGGQFVLHLAVWVKGGLWHVEVCEPHETIQMRLGCRNVAEGALARLEWPDHPGCILKSYLGKG